MKTGCVVGSRPVAATSREEILRLIVLGREAARKTSGIVV
jgi:hypothetical protein